MSFTYQTEAAAEDERSTEDVVAQPRAPIPIYTVILIASFAVVAAVAAMTVITQPTIATAR